MTRGKSALLLLVAAGFAAAQTANKPLLGTVTGFKVESLELGVKPDSGPARWIKFGPETQVLLVAPGETDLSKARPAQIGDIAVEDRVMVSYVAGMKDARRILLISASAIARRDAAERLDWEKRGISGVVTARDGNEIDLEIRGLQATQHATIVVTPKTRIRRYAPDSVKFADAQPASLNDLAIGDQVRTRGAPADDLVFGTFLTTIGSVTEVNRETNEVTITSAASQHPLTVRLTPDTQLKKMPDLRAMIFGSPHAEGATPPANMSQMLQQLPAGSLDDLKVGSSVVVTSTRGSRPDRVTGIMVVANIDALLQMAQSQAKGESPMDALNRMHGGAFGGPGGFSLPAIGQ